MERDGSTQSPWQATESYQPVNNSFDSQVQYDVVIAGGGITGLTTALLLQSSGKKCLLTEAYTIGFGTTGGTTAHLNTFFDTPYQDTIKDFGIKGARLLAQGAKAAIALIKSNVHSYNIDCEFAERDGFVLARDEQQQKDLSTIVEGCKEVDVAADFTNNSPFPIPYTAVAIFPNQAQFHPNKYINGLARQFEELGGVIVEDNRVNDVEEKGDALVVKTEKGEIHARQLVYATHLPPGINLLHLRCAPYRSYAMAVKLKSGDYPEAMGYDLYDPYHYYRTQQIDNEKYLVVGGEDHKTGHEQNTEQCFRMLESHVRSFFDVEEIAYKWSSQYYEPADGLAYIGSLPGNGDNVFVATGFGGNGMIYGTLSGIVLSNLLVNGHSIYEELFDPNRLKPVAGFTNFIKENTDVVSHFIKDRFAVDKIKELAEIAAGEARVVKYEGHTIAVYKDEHHELHMLNSICPHMKCTVGWNASEKSWDCPCHGARFSISGELLCGPAPTGLEKLQPEAIAHEG